MEGRNGRREGGRMAGKKEGKKGGRREGRSMYVRSNVCNCIMEHATVGPLGLFNDNIV